MPRPPATASRRIVLQRMGHLLGEPRYLAAAERMLAAAWPVLAKASAGDMSLLTALEELLHPPQIISSAGRRRDRGLARSWRGCTPRAAWCWRWTQLTRSCRRRWPTSLRVPAAGRLCLPGSACSAPLDSLGALLSELRSTP